jgi:hypothetical protein
MVILLMNRTSHRFVVPSYKCRKISGSVKRKYRYQFFLPDTEVVHDFLCTVTIAYVCVSEGRGMGVWMDAFDQSFHRQWGSAFDQSFQCHLLRKGATERRMLHHISLTFLESKGIY